MRTVIGVMGGGTADEATTARARELGSAIAERGWVLLNGGRDCGVMAASAAGARAAGGFVVGVLPDEDSSQATPDLDVAIRTGMGDARNVINVLSSDVVIALSGGAGTLSEVAHAVKLGRPVVLLGMDAGALFADARAQHRLVNAASVAEAVALAARFLGEEDAG